MESKIQDRNKNFQKSLCDEVVQGVRDNYVVELRKKKRNDHILKKRAFVSKEKQTQALNYFSSIPDRLNPAILDYSQIFHLANEIRDCSDLILMTSHLQTFKSIAANYKYLPYSDFFDESHIEKMMKILSSDELPIKLTVLWIITNIFYYGGNLIQRFMQKNILELLYDMVKNSPCPDIVENCFWALGNFVGESTKHRDLVISKGFIDELIQNCRNSDYGIKNSAFWVLSNLSFGKPNINSQNAVKIIQVASDGLSSESSEIIHSTVAIIQELTEKHSEIVNIVINTALVQDLFEILKGNDQNILIKTLKIFGNIAGGTDKQTQKLIDLKFVQILYKFLNSPSILLQKEAFFIASNILASDDSAKISFLTSPCIKLVVEGMSSANLSIKKEAVIGISNCIFSKDSQLACALLSYDILSGFISALDESDENLLKLVLSSLKNLMKNVRKEVSGDKWEWFLKRFAELEGKSKLEELTYNVNSKIANEARDLIRKYFEEEGQEMAGVTHSPLSLFEFG